MLRSIPVLLVLALTSTTIFAGPRPFPAGMRTLEVNANGATYHVRVGGKGPPVLMLHGFGDTGDMWAPLAAEMIDDHTVVIPDLRGMGLSSHPEDGYDKKTQGKDMAAILDRLKIARVDLVTHDIGNMVGYAFAAQYPDRVTRYVIMDAPIPGIGAWDEMIRAPALWHFNFRGPDAERLVAGRERIYLDRFYNEFSATPTAVDEGTRKHYATLYARPQAMHDAFAQFAAFGQDAIDNKALLAKGKLSMPILAIGGDASFGTVMAEVMRAAATNVTETVIADSGHWLMEEQPAATVAAIRQFLDTVAAERRFTPDEITRLPVSGADAGTSQVRGIETTVLSGVPTQQGLYTLRLYVPAHTTIQAHSHRDDRSAIVISGAWYFGYGAQASTAALKEMQAGSFYTEPAGAPHFAATKDQPAVVYITGEGPTDTLYEVARSER